MASRKPVQTILTGLLVALWLVLPACGDGDSPSEPTGQSYAGVWVGETSSSRPVRMVLSSTGAVDSLAITVRLSVGGGSCTGPLLLVSPAAAEGSSFEATVEFPGPNISSDVSGTFSGTSMSGTYDGYSASFSLVCGGSYIVGSGSPLSAGSWQATKQ